MKYRVPILLALVELHGRSDLRPMLATRVYELAVRVLTGVSLSGNERAVNE